ncbi:hypothetical protein DYB37_000484 [Aphanomyces astaci]|uniref:Uncharacterized protein n=1 Tax=Aphanomyces astaci TaxID=112090 RepID=A0A3R6X249_APHAT|nr:hypothetical protein DYB35_003018 [Aphanomyces astaci]RHZ30011.1 hypothetical protein DYB37_000484 [Aphanomyces astaci]
MLGAWFVAYRARGSKRETDVESKVPIVDEHVVAAEAALQEALQRARSIRNAQVKQHGRPIAGSSSAALASPQQPSPPLVTGAPQVVGDDTHTIISPPDDQHCPRRRHQQLPRHVVARMGEVADQMAIWSSQDSPARTFLGKLNQLLSTRDTSPPSADTDIPPPRIPYREQVFRLQYAYKRILHVLHDKCQSYAPPPDAPPSLSRVFPVWYRLHKIKKLLDEMNQELSSVLRRATAQRSASFLHAIRSKKPPRGEVDNSHLVAAVQAVDPTWSADVAAVYEKLQKAWEAKDYASCVHEIARDEISKLVVPHVEHMLHVTTASKGEVVEALMLLRLLHSVACCDGLMLRSFVRG